MKTYIVKWYKKTRSGAWRDYRKLVKIDDIESIESYVQDKMCLAVGCVAYGEYNGNFQCATEVTKTTKFGYEYESVIGGEYWYVKDDKIVHGTVKWNRFYDHKLKGWLYSGD